MLSVLFLVPVWDFSCPPSCHWQRQCNVTIQVQKLAVCLISESKFQKWRATVKGVESEKRNWQIPMCLCPRKISDFGFLISVSLDSELIPDVHISISNRKIWLFWIKERSPGQSFLLKQELPFNILNILCTHFTNEDAWRYLHYICLPRQEANCLTLRIITLHNALLKMWIIVHNIRCRNWFQYFSVWSRLKYFSFQ